MTRFIRPAVFEARTGYTIKAFERKIQQGVYRSDLRYTINHIQQADGGIRTLDKGCRRVLKGSRNNDLATLTYPKTPPFRSEFRSRK